MAFLQTRTIVALRSRRDEFRRVSPSSFPRRPVLKGYRICIPSAQGDNPESVSGSLTEEEARSILGVSPGTSFEDVVKVKNRLLASPNTTDEAVREIQSAYDLLLMKSMTKRVQRSEDVPTDVRYADVQKTDISKEARKVLSKIPTGGMAIEYPSDEILRSNSIALGLLALCILPQGFSEVSMTYDTIPGLYLALAFIWSVYSLRQYRLLGFGRAVGYTFLGLMTGACLGGALEAALHLKEHPIGAFHSPATLVSEFSLIGIWACATFLA